MTTSIETPDQPQTTDTDLWHTAKPHLFVCACCDETGKPGAPGAGGADWLCDDCSSDS